MARPAKKKAANKTLDQSKNLSAKLVSAIDKVESKLKAASVDVQQKRESLSEARSVLRTKRQEAAKKGTRASQAVVDRAYAAVAKKVTALDEAHRKERLAKAKLKVENILHRVEKSELNAEEKILALEARLAEQAEDHLKAALEKFEARWRKKRALTDARKLRIAKKNTRLRTQTITKKAQAEIRLVEKKTASALAKPVKASGRPGRPKKKNDAAADKGVALPKKRGRPAKQKDTSAIAAAPKKRGRPPKAAASNKAVSAAPKKRGRPPKVQVASATKMSAKTPVGVSGSAPKRRGRPPKVK